MDTKLVTRLLNNLLIGKSIIEIRHYQAFQILLYNDEASANTGVLRLVMHSDWYLGDEKAWQLFIKEFPDTYAKNDLWLEPIKAFVLFRLKISSLIEAVDLLDDHSLVIKFDNSDSLTIPAKSDFTESGWILSDDQNTETPDWYFINCENGELLFSKTIENELSAL